MRTFRSIVLTLLTCVAGWPSRAEEITVFAAASLTESLKEIGAAYERQTGDKVVFSFAASGPLRRQIEEGAPADIFFPADEASMDGVDMKGLIDKGSRRSRLSNLLVIVTAADHPAGVAAPVDLASASVRRLALGDPRTVPAGTYAREYLVKLGLWAALEPRIVPCESVRAVLAAVESGNVDAGMVYKTDAAISRKVKVVFEVPAKEGPKISYPFARVRDSKRPAAAARFLDYLSGPEAGRVFASRGFMLLPQEPGK